MDWGQLWAITSAPDNIPIVAMLFLVPFFTWYALRQARANDQLIAQLEADPQMAKTHHRKVQPWRPRLGQGTARLAISDAHRIPRGVDRDGHSDGLVHHAQRAARRTGQPESDNEPVESAVVLPRTPGDARLLRSVDCRRHHAGLIIVGLMAIPYMDTNPLGSGYYTWKQRKFSIGAFCFGFIVLWVAMIIIGTFIRGPGWVWFNLGAYLGSRPAGVRLQPRLARVHRHHPA